MRRDRPAFLGHPEMAVLSLRRSLVRLMLALVAGAALALVVSWTASEAATTSTTTTPSTETVTSTQTVTSTTTTTATAPAQTTTLTETKTAAAPAPTTSITNHTTTVQTAPTTQTANNSSGTVPTWAWVVMGLGALAILALIGLLVRERDLRTNAEKQASAHPSYSAASGYGSPESGYGGQQSGRGSPPPGPDGPAR